ncbi:hypothetical protein F0562_002208 [Nyssa sinensis]|uniref:Uncharacterized protein n=1 Tax=Nyssa sinensis TaxID=561372 RepID=A0A5J5C6R3_9ASTE|nr:hypothetical protein F0562_002208 [Nyssa sinensis]
MLEITRIESFLIMWFLDQRWWWDSAVKICDSKEGRSMMAEMGVSDGKGWCRQWWWTEGKGGDVGGGSGRRDSGIDAVAAQSSCLVAIVEFGTLNRLPVTSHHAPYALRATHVLQSALLGFPVEEDQVGLCEHLDAPSPFNPFSEM